jgi:hypothetical protein
MKINSRRANVKFFVAPFALLLLLFAICPHSAVAQTNTFPASGNVGVGTTSPPNPLTITRSGSTPYTSRPAYELLQLIDRTDNTPQILFGSNYNGMLLRYTGTDYTATNERIGIFTGGSVEAFVVNNDGNVGIGTTAPTAKLHVSGTGNTQSIVQSTTAAAELDLISNGAGSGSWSIGTGWSSAGATRNLFFYDNVAGATRLVVNSSGNVGIGTTAPSTKLHVLGDVNVTGTGNITAAGTITAGNIVAKYQDVAEWVPSAHALAGGTVVTLDPTKSNHVEASSRPYDTRVAGVVSEQPGITLGERGDNKVLVATTGRVRIKVDASRASIQVGDLLVTSEVPGLAMKSQPIDIGGVQIHRPGTIIGKALEPLARGRGQILVLLSLQ